MADPAIKGVLFAGVVDDVHAALEEGRLSRDVLEARLEPGDLALLDDKVNSISWYDIFAYHRILDALCEAEGKDAFDFWFARGHRAAKRLLDSGLYQQLDYLGRTESGRLKDPEAKFKAFGRDLKLIMTIQAAMLNFGDWSCVPDPDAKRCYQIEIAGVRDIPDGVFIAAAGIFNGFAEAGSGSIGWTYERPKRDLVMIRMKGPLPD